MIRNLRRCLPLLSLAVACCANLAIGAVWTSDAQFGSWANGGYTIYNNEWNATHGWQTIWANSYSNWGVASNQPNGAVRAYPECVKTINKSISSYTSSSSWNVTPPSAGSIYWNVSYDCWVPSEIMVWVNQTSGIHPIGSLQYSNVSIDGTNWNVWQGGSPSVVSFVRSSYANSGSVHLGTLFRYAESKGWVSNTTISSVDFGFEIDGTSNTTQNYTVNSMSSGS